MSVLYQVIGTTIVCFPCLIMGVMYAWPSSTLFHFTSPNTILNRRMTEVDVALFGSLSSVGAMVGTLLMAWLLDVVGRKKCTILSGLIGVISWVIIASTTSVEVILTAVFLSGFSGSSFLIVPVYVSEFCHENIRGTMASCSMVFYGIGILVSYILGGYFSYFAMIYIAMTLAALQVVSMVWLVESPLYLLQNNMTKQASESIAFYRRVNVHSKIVEQELAIMRKTLNFNNDESMCSEDEKLDLMDYSKSIDSKKSQIVITIEKPRKKVSLWKFFRKSRVTRRAFLIATVIMSTAMFEGLIAVQVYAEPLFTEAVPEMSATLCTVIFAVTITIASIVAAFMSDLVGRRPLSIYSAVGSGVCCIMIGTQIQTKWAPWWLTTVFIYLFSAVYSFGAGTVPFVLLAEVFLPEVKSFMIMMVVEFMWLSSFFTLVVYNPLVATVGLGPVFYILGFVCFLTAGLSIVVVPETMGLSLDLVQKLLEAKKFY